MRAERLKQKNIMTTETINVMSPEHKEYLDELRESGVTNMWGAPAYVEARFKLSFKEASAIVSEWMRTFKK